MITEQYLLLNEVVLDVAEYLKTAPCDEEIKAVSVQFHNKLLQRNKAKELIEELQKTTDLFCDVMEQLSPKSHKEHTEMVLLHLIEQGKIVI